MGRAALLLAFFLAGCGGGPLSFLTGGGPNVAANVQAGAENRQSAVSVERQAPTVSIRPNARTGNIRQESGDTRVRADSVQTIVYKEGIPWWGWVLIGFALWLDSPKRWPGQIRDMFRRKR